MTEYWPSADQDPDASEPEVEFANIWRRATKYVFSRTLTEAEWNTTVIPRVVPGQGRPLFESPDVQLNLTLEETRTFGNGVALLRYSNDTPASG